VFFGREDMVFDVEEEKEEACHSPGTMKSFGRRLELLFVEYLLLLLFLFFLFVPLKDGLMADR